MFPVASAGLDADVLHPLADLLAFCPSLCKAMSAHPVMKFLRGLLTS